MIDDSASLGADKTCFIVSPIGNKFEPRGAEGRQRYEDNLQIWADVLEPACDSVGLRPVRADKIAETGEITEQIFQYLRDSDVVIADLSGANPNVMYELGLRHTRDLLTIQIGEHGHLPFDVNTIRTIQFRRTEAGLIEAREALIETLTAGLQGKRNPVAATRIWNDAQMVVKAEDVARAVEASVEEEDDDPDMDEPGFIDILAEGEGALSEVQEELAEASQIMAEIGDLTAEVAPQIQRSDNEGKGFAGRLLIAKGLAGSLSAPARRFEELASEYSISVAKMDAMVDFMLDRWESGEETAGEESAQFLSSVQGLIEAAESTTVSLTSFLGQVKGLRKISKELLPVSKTIERSLNRYISGNNTIAAWRGRTEDLLSQG